MLRRWFQRSAACAFLVLLAACDDAAQPPLTAPAEPQAEVVTDGAGRSYTVVTGRLPDNVRDEVEATIGQDGGRLSLAGHTLVVPRGAVSEPTLFRLKVKRDGYVRADLSAVVKRSGGSNDNVGERGFQRPVTLSLTYAWSDQSLDPARLLIMWFRDGGGVEPQPSTVNAGARTVSARLTHFSRYGMVSN